MNLTVAKIDALRERRDSLLRELSDYRETFGDREQAPAFARRNMDRASDEIARINADIGEGY